MFEVDGWRHRVLGPVPNVWPLRVPSGDTKSLLQSFFNVEMSKFESGSLWKILLVPDWPKFWSLTFDSAGIWDRCQKICLSKWLSRIPKVFFHLFSSSRYRGLSEATLGELWKSKIFKPSKFGSQFFSHGGAQNWCQSFGVAQHPLGIPKFLFHPSRLRRFWPFPGVTFERASGPPSHYVSWTLGSVIKFPQAFNADTWLQFKPHIR